MSNQDSRLIRCATEFGRDLWLGDYRALKREPLFAVSAVVILALGIGASVTMLSLLQAIVLRPLPYDAAGRAGQADVAPHRAGSANGTSMANFLDWRAQNRTFADMTVYSPARW